MDEPRGRLRTVRPADTAGYGPQDWVRTWTIAMDALARASVAAAAATAGEQLRAQTADALAGPFADWAFVDLGDGPPWRAVAARRPDPWLTDVLSAVGRAECPLVTSALEHGAPLLAAPAVSSPLVCLALGPAGGAPRRFTLCRPPLGRGLVGERRRRPSAPLGRRFRAHVLSPITTIGGARAGACVNSGG